MRKSGRVTKASAKTTVELDSQPQPHQSRKRSRKNATKEPKQQPVSRVEEEPESTPEAEAPPKPPKNISLETYTLIKSVLLGTVAVIEDTDFLKHDEFDFLQFQTQAIRKLDKAIPDASRTFELVSGSATITAKNVPARLHLVMVVEDGLGWIKVEKGIERWMLENKKEISVKLAMIYRKTGESDDDSSDDEKLSRKKVLLVEIWLI